MNPKIRNRLIFFAETEVAALSSRQHDLDPKPSRCAKDRFFYCSGTGILDFRPMSCPSRSALSGSDITQVEIWNREEGSQCGKTITAFDQLTVARAKHMKFEQFTVARAKHTKSRRLASYSSMGSADACWIFETRRDRYASAPARFSGTPRPLRGPIA